MEFIQNYYLFIIIGVLFFGFVLFGFNQVRLLIKVQREQIHELEQERTTKYVLTKATFSMYIR